MTRNPSQRLMLSVYPVSRGFGYAVFESPSELVDWGVKATRTDKEKATQRKVASLMEDYTRDALILPSPHEKGSRRSNRVIQLIVTLRAFASSRGLRVHFVSKARLRKHFAAFGAQTREEIAGKIAKQFPDLKPWLPRHRKPWLPDEYHMAVFQAGALGVAHRLTE